MAPKGKKEKEKKEEQRTVISLEPPSGTRDFFPDDMRQQRWLFTKFREVANLYGFQEYDAPVLEHEELYKRKAGEEITQQMYNFVDKEGALVTLRPEMTPSLARMVLNLMRVETGEIAAVLPLKWFSIPQCWRFETTQRGRKREHYQWNMDIVGISSIYAEAEVLSAVVTFFESVGITSADVGLKVNSRKVLGAVLKNAGVPDDKFAPTCVIIDKQDKIGADAVKKELQEQIGLDKGVCDRIVDATSAGTLEEFASLAGVGDSEEVKELQKLFDLAKDYGYGDWLQFDASVVRGLAYYTGVVFEGFDKAGILRAICGGGRYDRLLTLYGSPKEVPCIGFGFGDCVIAELLKEKKVQPSLPATVDFVVAAFNMDMMGQAYQVARRLRMGGKSVDVFTEASKKVAKAFNYADRVGAIRIAFVAPDEWAKGMVRIKDLRNFKADDPDDLKQRDVPLEDLASVDSYFGGAPAPAAAAPAPPAACTVYVGRISTEVSDDFVKQLLEKCGKITKWNRAADPNTSKLTSFGFCDFEDPQGVWRALQFLHEKQLCDKRLLVKCEEKAKQTITVWKDGQREVMQKRQKEGDKKEGDKKEGDKKEGPLTDEELEAMLKEENKAVEKELADLLAAKNKGYPEIKLDSAAEDKDGDKAAKKGAEKADADSKENKDTANEKRDEKEDRGTKRGRSADRGRDDDKRKRERDEEKEKEKEKKPSALSRHYRQSRRERDRETRLKERERDIEKEYQYRIREFERGEDKRISNLKRDLRELEDAREGPSEREKRKLLDRDLHFGRDRDDDRDWKRHRADREKDRAKEAEKDAADKAAEKKDLEEERAKQKDEEERRRKEEDEARRKAQKEADEKRRREEEEAREQREKEERERREAEERKRREEREAEEAEQRKVQKAAAEKLLAQVSEEMSKVQVEGVPKDSKIAGILGTSGAHEAFRDDSPDRKHKPLQRLDGAGGPGEAKLRDDEMRRLIQQVPTDKAKAFAYSIDWSSVVEHNIIEKKLRPWVKKKVNEYLGAEEQGMVEFIMRKVGARADPNSILAELEGFLDEEAENFTLKMWRMLIFEVLRVRAR